MDVEEKHSSQSMDGSHLDVVVCDKTTPSLVMGAASVEHFHFGGFRRTDAGRKI